MRIKVSGPQVTAARPASDVWRFPLQRCAAFAQSRRTGELICQIRKQRSALTPLTIAGARRGLERRYRRLAPTAVGMYCPSFCVREIAAMKLRAPCIGLSTSVGTLRGSDCPAGLALESARRRVPTLPGRWPFTSARTHTRVADSSGHRDAKRERAFVGTERVQEQRIAHTGQAALLLSTQQRCRGSGDFHWITR